MDWKQLLYFSLSSDLVLGSLREHIARTAVTVLAYHELAEDHVDLEAWTVVRKSDFLRQVDYLARHYDIVTMDQALQHMQSPTLLRRPLAVITFDDGDRGSAEVLLPIVETLQIPVAVYVATRQVKDGASYWFDKVINALQADGVVVVDLDEYKLGRYQINRSRGAQNWRAIESLLEGLKSLAPTVREVAVEKMLAGLPVERRRKNCHIEPMSIEDVRSLATCSFVTVGAHSHCHNILTQLDRAAMRQSIQESKRLLEEWTDRTVDHFAYPNGSYDDATAEAVRHSGFRSAVTFDARLWRGEDSPYLIPRLGIGRYDSLEKFKLNLVGGLRRLWRNAA